MNNRTKVTSIILLILLVGAGISYWYTENTPDALYRKGIKYHNTNQAKAIKYYEKADKKDHYRAQNNLAVLYIESQNSQNLPKARHLLEKMLQKNNKDTQVLFHLGNLLSEENYLGYDPENSSRLGDNKWGTNRQFFTYPRPRTYTMGINVTF